MTQYIAPDDRAASTGNSYSPPEHQTRRQSRIHFAGREILCPIAASLAAQTVSSVIAFAFPEIITKRRPPMLRMPSRLKATGRMATNKKDTNKKDTKP